MSADSAERDMRGKTALVTGATSGLGRAVVIALSEQGLRVLVHGRDAHRVGLLVEELRSGGEAAEPFVADLASLAEVRLLAERVRARCPVLDVLINNAGVGFGPPPQTTRELSADGHELRFAVNYLAPVLLARSLTPLLLASAPARVVNVGSAGQATVDFDDIEFTSHYHGVEAYRRSKFALAAFTIDLADELPGEAVTVNCLHPASFMDTGMVRDTGVTPWAPVAEGVPPVLNLAIGAAAAQRTGQYFDRTQRAKAHPLVYDEHVRARLRHVTDALLAPFLDR
jgi:NAD(P)-dependent dehydrogenase (short-subunit alcohol dehydrogenase family)